MDVNVTLALIALATVVVTQLVTPIVVGYVQYRIGVAQRAEDRLGRERVAAAVAEVAKAQSDHTELIDSKLDEMQTLGVSTHALVNSRLSAILLSLHDALVGQIEALKDNVVAREKNGEPAKADAMATIETLQKRLSQLTVLMVERDKEPVIKPIK